MGFAGRGQLYRASHARRFDPAWAGVLLFALFAALVAARAPGLITHPRLWGEEGALFLAYAYAHTFWEALTAPILGYLSFPANLGTALGAKLLPVELAPVATLGVAFLVQVTPAIVLLTADAEELRSWWRRAAVLAVWLVVLPSHEVWLNTVNSQFHLCAASGLILAFRPRGPGAAWGWRLILAAGGLSGIVSAALAPLFALEAWRTRERERIIQTVILGAGGAVQAGMIVAAFAGGSAMGLADPNRGPPAPDLLILALSIKSLFAPIAGPVFADTLANALRAAPHSPAWWAMTAVGVALLAGALLLFARVGASVRLFAAFLIVIIVPAFGWLGEKLPLISYFPGGRYFYASNIFFAVALTLVVLADVAVWARAAAAVLVAAILVNGVIDYTSRGAIFEGPDWRTEVRRWRAGETEAIAIHPEWFLGVRMPPGLRAGPN